MGKMVGTCLRHVDRECDKNSLWCFCLNDIFASFAVSHKSSIGKITYFLEENHLPFLADGIMEWESAGRHSCQNAPMKGKRKNNMQASKKYSYCLSEFDKFFISLPLRYTSAKDMYRGHIEDERQTLGYLILKIWTIFKPTQIASNGAHAGAYIPVRPNCRIYHKRELFYLLPVEAVQSRSMVT